MLMTILNMPREHSYTQNLKYQVTCPPNWLKWMLQKGKKKKGKERFKDSRLLQLQSMNKKNAYLQLQSPTQGYIHPYLVQIISSIENQIKLQGGVW